MTETSVFQNEAPIADFVANSTAYEGSGLALTSLRNYIDNVNIGIIATEIDALQQKIYLMEMRKLHQEMRIESLESGSQGNTEILQSLIETLTKNTEYSEYILASIQAVEKKIDENFAATRQQLEQIKKDTQIFVEAILKQSAGLCTIADTINNLPNHLKAKFSEGQATTHRAQQQIFNPKPITQTTTAQVFNPPATNENTNAGTIPLVAPETNGSF